MKKIILSVIALSIGAGIAAADETHYRLTAMKDDDNGGEERYYYDALNRCVGYDREMGEELRMRYVYDDAGNIVRENGYQDVFYDNSWPLKLYYEYTYDEQNRVQTMKAYTYWKAAMDVAEFGGGYRWEYDEFGHIAKRLTYTDEELTQEFQRTTYTYDADGRLAQADDEVYDLYTKAFRNESQMKFYYDEQGRMVHFTSSAYNRSSNELELRSHDFWVYDGDDLVEYYRTGPSGTVKQKSIEYISNEVPVDRVTYPMMIDDPAYHSSEYTMFKHQVELANEYARGDDDSAVLMFTWEYVYEEIDPDNTGIDSAAANLNVLRGVNINGDRMTLDGVKSVESATIYDLNGRVQLEAGHVGADGINIGSLQPGAYIIHTPEGSMKFRR